MGCRHTIFYLMFRIAVLSGAKVAQVASLHGRLQVEEVVSGGTACKVTFLTASFYHSTIVIYASYHLSIKFICLMGKAKVAEVAWFTGGGIII